MDERANKIERRLHWTNGAVAELYADHIDPETGEIIRLELSELRAQAAGKAQTREQKAQMRALLQEETA